MKHTLLTLTACSPHAVTRHVAGRRPPLCGPVELRKELKFAVYWGAAWREDQKEVARREEIISAGLREYFSDYYCMDLVGIEQSADFLLASDEELAARARALGANRALLLRFEELGPTLTIGLSLALWQTHNEVELNARLIDAQSGRALSAVSADWRRGGPYTLNSVSDLPDDLRGVLGYLFEPRKK